MTVLLNVCLGIAVVTGTLGLVFVVACILLHLIREI